MSTKIKKNGNWVTVAGGTRMWVGTKAALQAALDAGELVDGTAVMVTDDYDEGGDIKQAIITATTNTAGGVQLPTEYVSKNIIAAKRIDNAQDNAVLVLGNIFLFVVSVPELKPVVDTFVTIRITYTDVQV